MNTEISFLLIYLQMALSQGSSFKIATFSSIWVFWYKIVVMNTTTNKKEQNDRFIAILG